VTEVDPRKRSVLLLNKSDFLPADLRLRWGEHLDSIGVEFAFFSALLEGEKVTGGDDDDDVAAGSGRAPHPADDLGAQPTGASFSVLSEGGDTGGAEDAASADAGVEDGSFVPPPSGKDSSASAEAAPAAVEQQTTDESVQAAGGAAETEPPTPSGAEEGVGGDASASGEGDGAAAAASARAAATDAAHTSPRASLEERCRLRSCVDLLSYLRDVAQSTRGPDDEGLPTIGMVGYPNVGKSSTVNALCAEKKVCAAVPRSPALTHPPALVWTTEYLKLTLFTCVTCVCQTKHTERSVAFLTYFHW
jgi:large subunit GTPase 1